MTLDEFKTLVRRAEVDIAQRPRAYRLRLFGLAALGYGVVFGLGAIAITLLGGSIALAFYSTAWVMLLIQKKLIFALVAILWVLFKALWIRIEPPQGVELQRQDFPVLFAELDQLRAALRAPRLHRVLLTPQLNAAVVRTPRLGVLGWHRNTLVLGIELLMVLSPSEAKAVLAHELGHLSGRHNRFSAWIYSVRAMWSVLMETYDRQSGFAAGWLRRFLDWYAPRFNAYSFALARQNEYEADHLSAAFTSADDAVRALVNVHVTGPFIDEHFWREFYRQADHSESPVVMPYSGLQAFLHAHPLSQEEQQLRLANVLEVDTSYDDTHPCLRERVQALQKVPAPVMPAVTSAAARWLGERFSQVVEALDQLWWHNASTEWHERFRYASEGRQALLVLEARNIDSLSDEELWQLAEWSEEFREVDPLPNFQQCWARQPDNAMFAYAVGRLLAQRNDPACLPALEVAASSRQWVTQASEQAYYFFKRQLRDNDAEQWRLKAVAQMEYDQRARQERATLSIKDVFMPPQGLDDVLWSVAGQWAKHPKVRHVWAAQKQVQQYPEHPVLVLAVKPKGYIFTPTKLARELLASLELPMTVFVIVQAGEHKKGARRVIKKGLRVL